MPRNNKSELSPGKKFNRLTVLKFSHSDKRWRKWYLVRCDCGKEKTIMGSAMVSGNTKSCGCLAKETKQTKRISENHSDITAIILGYKRHAERRGFKWLLSRSFVEKLIKENCFYCGSSPSNKKKTKNSIGDGLLYSGIDRINSNKDYTEDNVVACCRICNYAKSNMTIEDFRLWAVRIGKKAMADQWGAI
jgi:hypothetical protein